MDKKLYAGLAILLGCFSSCSAGKLVNESISLSDSMPELGLSSYSLADSLKERVRWEKVPVLKIDAWSIYRQMIDYVTPTDEASSRAVKENIAVYLSFPAGSSRVNARYGNNRMELEKLKERLNAIFRTSGNEIGHIRLTGYASPDGSTAVNERLAGGRAIEFRNYLVKEFGLPLAGLIDVEGYGEDWVGLRRLIADSDKPYREKVLKILDQGQDADQWRTRIKALEKGGVYKDIEKNYFSRLRRMELVVEFESQIVRPDVAAVAKIYEHPEKFSLNDLLKVAGFYRPGTEQYREIYEMIAYAYPACRVAQLNAAAGSLALGDKETARYFFTEAKGDIRAYNNLGVLAFIEGDHAAALEYFRKARLRNPRLARKNIEIVRQWMENDR